jgi:hypothetical protein
LCHECHKYDRDDIVSFAAFHWPDSRLWETIIGTVDLSQYGEQLLERVIEGCLVNTSHHLQFAQLSKKMLDKEMVLAEPGKILHLAVSRDPDEDQIKILVTLLQSG